jgi:molybdopterin molybdotransferase
MKDFFKVSNLNDVRLLTADFPSVDTERVLLRETPGRILAEAIISEIDIPGFSRTTMDGYAVRASSTYGASEGMPAYLTVKGTVVMGDSPDFTIGPGEAARISTGGMLPEGADSVVMIEHTDAIDAQTIEVYRSVAPGQHVIAAGDDVADGQTVLFTGQLIRPQETGLLAAVGRETVLVFRRPLIGVISTGDEVVPVHETPGSGCIRDINTYTLGGMIEASGGIPVTYGIVPDNRDALFDVCAGALNECDMVFISGGSSVGTRDFTIEVLSALPESEILVHGISISPGKPTILARCGRKAFWGLPGHVTSAMVVYKMVVEPFIRHIAGLQSQFRKERFIPARLTRNVASAQGRVDYVRVEMKYENGENLAEPVLGKSGMIRTMVGADGLIEIPRDTEGLDAGATVKVIPF